VKALHYLVSLFATKRADLTDTDPSDAYKSARADLIEYTHNNIDYLRPLEGRDLYRHFDSRD